MNLTTFFVRPSGSSGCAETVAELNIIIIGNYSSINLYAQLVLVAELRPKQCSLRLSADAASATTGHDAPVKHFVGTIMNYLVQLRK